MELLMEATGQVRCVYDELIDLAALGRMTIARGSHVEPMTDGRWTVDLSPVAGPRLGPFAHRSAALAAERDWLRDHWLVTHSTEAGSAR
ncbi:MAG: hypothetical protein KDA59_25650 [Planctomycetales bacterium]|nr:hypothetical protein [Planctomycetales bacterium]